MRICHMSCTFFHISSLLRPGLSFPKVLCHVLQAQVSILGIFMAGGRFCSPEYAAWMQPFERPKQLDRWTAKSFWLACPDTAFPGDLFAVMYILCIGMSYGHRYICRWFIFLTDPTYEDLLPRLVGKDCTGPRCGSSRISSAPGRGVGMKPVTPRRTWPSNHMCFF